VGSGPRKGVKGVFLENLLVLEEGPLRPETKVFATRIERVRRVLKPAQSSISSTKKKKKNQNNSITEFE
jgi:hypothetical protein